MGPVQHGAESPEQALIRDRSIRLFTFLKELTELRSKTTRSCDRYEKVLWFHEIPRNHGCHCIAWRAVTTDELSDVWVEVTQPKFKKPPDISERIKEWVDTQQIEDSQLESPKLRDRIIAQKSQAGTDEPNEVHTEVIELADSPEIPPLFERYVREKWIPWAEEDRKLREVQEVYSDLFSIYQKQQRLGEVFEVVLGLGCLVWKLPSGQDVKRHIITTQVNLAFDSERGIITLGPAADGPRPTLEQDMLDPNERPDAVEQRALEGQVNEIGDAVWDGTKIPTALKSWVHAVSPGGRYEENLEINSGGTDKPTIYLAPALILRTRTDQRFLKVFQEIIDQLRNGEEVPVGVQRLVTIVDDRNYSVTETDEGSESSRASAVEEVFFPLPANNEQRQIVGALDTRQGVLVQGPPGTGKSHTITNLICHLLATGKRVLITSHTQRALRVLLDKFNSENHLKQIADLCVILLGDDLESRKALEDSVQSILNHYNSWNEEDSTRIINRLSAGLDRSRQAEAQTLHELRALRERETFRHPMLFGAYSGTAQEIAIRVRTEHPIYGWFNIRPDQDQQPPLSDEEATELLHILRSVSLDEERELRKAILSTDEIPSHSAFSDLVQEESAYKIQHESMDMGRSHAAYKGMGKLSSDVRRVFVEKLTNIIASFEGLTRHIHPWVVTAVTQILGDRDRAWRELANTTRRHLELIDQNRRVLRDRKVTGRNERNRSDLREDATELLVHLENGGSLGFLCFRHKTVRKNRHIIDEIRIDGQPCDNPDHLRTLICWINISESIDVFRKEWSPHTEPPSGSIQTQIAEYHDLCEPIDSALELLQQVGELKQLVSRTSGFYQPAWHKLEELHDLRDVGHAVDVEELLRTVTQKLTSIENDLRPRSTDSAAHQSSRELLEAVSERNAERYAVVSESIAGLRQRQEVLERRYELLNRLRAAAPLLAKELAVHHTDSAWDDRLASFSAAWNWARANRWIKEMSDPTLDRRLTQKLDDSRQRIQELLGQLGSERAWSYCIKRIGEPQRQHLVAWRQAVERIGKGKGKAAYVAKNREDARNHMQACRSAIPAWIMPVYRVAESFIPGKDAFDVVIVDEASQSGPEALFLQYLAKQIIVVGDDKQISPDHVGLTKGDVDLLRERNIKDIPFNDSLGIEQSFFDQAALRYGGRIRLQEHFRCMPEIIQFSNNLCYEAQPLIPLRQYGSGRLTPVLVTRHVVDGYQRGHSPRVDNPVEAKAIAEQIKLCCQDPAYDGKSMGVISLLGENQARLIERHLIDLIGPAEMKKRDIVCGDAYAFQGDERHVMFLSLVSAVVEGKRIGTLSGANYERRFNVAASRAKDQMWLFHTATLNDLSPQCLRHRLLSYVSNPQVQPLVLDGLTLEHIRTLAARADRRSDRPPHPFDSWFEVDVYLKIASRGFRVIPQFEMAGYFIDLLVEGMKGRLAVECDGDEVHGADRFDADMARQRMLERCGLNFWRIRESTFRMDENVAMEELWTILAQQTIHPASTDAAEPFTKRQTQGHPVQSSQVSPVVIDPEYGEEIEQVEPQNLEQPGSDPSWVRSEQPTIQDSLDPPTIRSGEREPEPLTDREKEILELIWAGFKNNEIGQRLKISVKTVEAHRANMMRKRRVSNVAQLLKMAIQDGTLKIQ